MKPLAVDLFCGAGGLSLGLEAAGFSIVGAFDTWAPAVRSYRHNFPQHPCFTDDVAELDAARLSELGIPSEVDLVAGGPPCQGFSIQRIGDDIDSRNDLVLDFIRVAGLLRAKMFVMENVTGLLGIRGKEVFSRLVKLAEDSGYRVEAKVLNAADFGLPQIRKRVFVVGQKIELSESFLFPRSSVSRHRTVAEGLAGLPPPAEKDEQSHSDPLHILSPLSPLNRQRIEIVPPGGGFEDLPLELRSNCHKAGAEKIGHRSVYGRLHPDRPAGTITAMFDSFTRGRFGHPIEPRNLTLREGARLQGFPDEHRFFGTKREITKQIGNAIPPPMAEAVARALRVALEGGDTICNDAKDMCLAGKV